MELGVWKVKNRKKCDAHYTCKGIATHYIGDKEKPQDPRNYYICDEHLELVYNKLLEIYNINSEPLKPTLNESNADDKAINQELTSKYLEMLYSSGGMTNKAKLKSFCEENGIELPKDVDELNTKGYMELIFPEVLVKEGD
jgi:hypothetical protein